MADRYAHMPTTSYPITYYVTLATRATPLAPKGREKLQKVLEATRKAVERVRRQRCAT